MFEAIVLFILIWSFFSMAVIAVSKIPALNNLPEFGGEKVNKKIPSYFLDRIKSVKGKARAFWPSITKETFYKIKKIKNLKNIKFTSWQNKEENETNLSDDYWEKIKKG